MNHKVTHKLTVGAFVFIFVVWLIFVALLVFVSYHFIHKYW